MADDRKTAFDPKYVHLVQEGLSRDAIEAQLLADGQSLDDVATFWQAVAYQALHDACDPRHKNNTDAIWRRLHPFQFFEPNYTLPKLAQPKVPGM